MSKLDIGETTYHFRQPVRGYFLPLNGTQYAFCADGFSPRFVGKGAKVDDAFCDWRDQVHEAFQELYGKRPFEMSPEEQERWAVLEDVIDVAGYRYHAPIVIRQIGKVEQARPHPRRIQWCNGKKEVVDLALMPPEFASYKPGQPFEADVQRHPTTWKLQKVLYVRRISQVRPLADQELQEFWDSLPGTNTLPVTQRDWTDS